VQQDAAIQYYEFLVIYRFKPKKIEKLGTATEGTSASTDRVPFKKVFMRLRLGY
jgi:hypothetical protein